MAAASIRGGNAPVVRRVRARGRLPKRVIRHNRCPAPRSGSQERVWFFDLDNTLHDASHAIFPHIDRAMTEAVMEALRLDHADATAMREKYWRKYGATMIGMVRHHDVCAADFLHRSHCFEIEPLVRGEKRLFKRLHRLPGRKIVLTNAPREYACRVLKTLGIFSCFDQIWAIEQMRFLQQFRVKPSRALYRHVLAMAGVSAHRSVLVEDTVANLKGAKEIGMRTVYIKHAGTPFARLHAGRAPYVDLTVNSLSALLRRRRISMC
ncbi:MAG: pyrimidine 5'-nucleotidase [Pigmentiphaga sp.]|nr:pyrimidine 5'-nucleotidase [Pigmentiphaga sp.]